jgi:UDP-N-acetylmuramate dehydrogenase
LDPRGAPKAHRRAPSAATAVALAGYTTLRVGGPAARMITVTSEPELIATLAELDRAGEPVLVLGGGSNLLVADAGFPGTVVRIDLRGITTEADACSGATLRVAAGEPWDELVAHTVTEGQVGLEALSGIPGLTGATPIQNVGAYGAEVSDTITQVRTVDRATERIRTFFAAECGFGYRTSRFKHPGPEDEMRAELVEAPGASTGSGHIQGRYVVTAATFQLKLGMLSAPVRYPELARKLGIAVGERAPAADVRAAVLALRASKGMVLAEEDRDTWSAGSFFTNPVLSAAEAATLPADAPLFPQPDGRVKTSAAWLIDAAGFGKGYGGGPARLSEKHSLALTNRGTARASDVLDLAREVRAGVRAAFGVTLVAEPVLVGCEL